MFLYVGFPLYKISNVIWDTSSSRWCFNLAMVIQFENEERLSNVYYYIHCVVYISFAYMQLLRIINKIF